MTPANSANENRDHLAPARSTASATNQSTPIPRKGITSATPSPDGAGVRCARGIGRGASENGGAPGFEAARALGFEAARAPGFEVARAPGFEVARGGAPGCPRTIGTAGGGGAASTGNTEPFTL